MAITAAVLRVGSMLAKTGGAIAKGGKVAMNKSAIIVKKSKKVAGNVKKAVFKKRKINKETFLSKDRAQKKKLEMDKRRQEEELLEKRNNKEKKPSAQKTMRKGGGVLQKIIDFISTVLIGWIVVNIPKIIESIKEVVKKIKNIYDRITGFFGSFGEFFSGIRDTVGSTLDSLKNLDFSNIGDTIKGKLDDFKGAFENMISDIGKGESEIESKLGEQPQTIVDAGINSNEEAKSMVKDDTKNTELKVSKLNTDTNNLRGEVLAGKSNFNDALSAAEKEMKKVDLKVVVNEIQGETINKSNNKISTKKINGKNLKSGEILKEQLQKVKGKIEESGSLISKNMTNDNSKLISKVVNPTDFTNSITPTKKTKKVIVNNNIPVVESITSQGKGQTQIIMVGKTLNSIVRENILLDAAYT